MRADVGVIVAVVCLMAAPRSSDAAGPRVSCPRAEHLPLLTIDDLADPAVPVIDEWQVMFQGVPLSDAQVAAMANDDPMIDLTRQEMTRRGTWVYIGIATAAAGTALSSIGWVLFGKDQKGVAEELALSMAIGGIAIGGIGTLLTVESIQTPMEPHIAPTPRHRMTREEIRRLVSAINDRLYAGICAAVERADNDRRERAERIEALRRGEANPRQIVFPSEAEAEDAPAPEAPSTAQPKAP